MINEHDDTATPGQFVQTPPIKPPAQAARLELAAMLRRLREERGLTQRALATQLRYGSHSTIVHLEAGRRIPSAEMITAYETHFALTDDRLRQLRRQVLVETAARHERSANECAVRLPAARSGEPPAEPGMAAGTPIIPPGGRPRRRTLFIVVLFALVMALSLAWTMRSTAAPAVRDGQDPYVHGCKNDETELERRPISWPDGRPYGEVVLFFSSACKGLWGYVYGPNSPNWTVYIAARRSDDDGLAVSSFQGAARPNSWGNALSSRHGCVFAEAWVRTGPVSRPVNGPVAATSCWAPS